MLPSSLEKLVARLERQPDPRRKYELLLALNTRLPALDPALRRPEHRVVGCTSQVYLVGDCPTSRMQFRGDADSQIVRGLVALLVLGLEDCSPDEIITLSPDFIRRTGLNVSLTPSRSNGFHNIFHRLQQLSLPHLAAAVGGDGIQHP